MAKKEEPISTKAVALIFIGASTISIAFGQMANDAAVAAIGIGSTILIIGMMYHSAANR